MDLLNYFEGTKYANDMSINIMLEACSLTLSVTSLEQFSQDIIMEKYQGKFIKESKYSVRI